MWSQRVRHNWTTSLSFFLSVVKKSACQFRSYQFDPWVRKIPWKRKWQSTPVLLPGKFHGKRSLEGYSPWGHKTARHDLATKQQFWPKPSAFRSHFGRKTVCYSLASSWIAPWTARRSNQSILKEISPEYSLKGLMLKLKLQYFGHLMWRTDSFEKTLMLGEIEGGRRREQQRMKWLDGIANSWTWVWVNSRSWWRTGRPGVLQSMGSQSIRRDWVTELNWIAPLMSFGYSCSFTHNSFDVSSTFFYQYCLLNNVTYLLPQGGMGTSSFVIYKVDNIFVTEHSTL